MGLQLSFCIHSEDFADVLANLATGHTLVGRRYAQSQKAVDNWGF